MLIFLVSTARQFASNALYSTVLRMIGKINKENIMKTYITYDLEMLSTTS